MKIYVTYSACQHCGALSSSQITTLCSAFIPHTTIVVLTEAPHDVAIARHRVLASAGTLPTVNSRSCVIPCTNAKRRTDAQVGREVLVASVRRVGWFRQLDACVVDPVARQTMADASVQVAVVRTRHLVAEPALASRSHLRTPSAIVERNTVTSLAASLVATRIEATDIVEIIRVLGSPHALVTVQDASCLVGVVLADHVGSLPAFV